MCVAVTVAVSVVSCLLQLQVCLCVGVGMLFVVGRIWVMQCVLQCMCCSVFGAVALCLYTCVLRCFLWLCLCECG